MTELILSGYIGHMTAECPVVDNTIWEGFYMRYEIRGGEFPVVICNLNDGEAMITERGSMV